MTTTVATRLGGRTFRSLRDHRNYRLWFAGQVVSVTGTWMQTTAQAWLVLELTGSPTAVGVLAAFQFAPFALFGLAGGALSDRLDRRRTLLVTQSVPIGFAVTLAILAATHSATVWEVDLLAMGTGLVQCLDVPARQAFTVEMVGREELPNAVALNSSLFNASRILGPGVGGVVIATAGVAVCFALNAASYGAVLAGLLLMNRAELHTELRTGKAGVLRGVAEGLAYARATPVVRAILVMMLFVGLVSINFNVLLPVVAFDTLHSGPQTLGLLSASFGAGALLGALLSASLRHTDVRVLVAGCIALGAGELLVAPQHSVAATAILLGVTGAAFTTYTSNSNSTIQLAVPDRLRGRVLSLYAFVFMGTAPLGGLAAGWLAERGGTGLAFTVAGATSIATGLGGAVWWWRSAARERSLGPIPPPSPRGGAVSAA